MKVKLITLGCKVNQYESQAMLEALLQAGFTEASPAEPAGVVVVNSCTVTAQSDHKVRQALRRANAASSASRLQSLRGGGRTLERGCCRRSHSCCKGLPFRRPLPEQNF